MCSNLWLKTIYLWAHKSLRLAGLLLLASCAGLPTQNTFPLAELKRASDGRSAMAGTIFLTQTQGGKSIRAPGVLLLRWPDQLRLEVQDPLGSTQVLLIIDGERFWLYQQNRKENLMGPVAQLLAVPEIPNLPFGKNLAGYFLGRLELEHWQKAQVDGGGATLTAGNAVERLQWDGRHQVSEWSRQTPKPGPTYSLQYQEFEFRAGTLYPTKIRWQSEGGNKPGQTILVSWEDWQPSVPEKNLFQIPPNQDFGRKTKALP